MQETKEFQEKIEKIKKILKEKQIENIYLNFVDFSGRILTKMVGVQELINNTHVSWFDGISLNGRVLNDFEDEKESDWLVLMPDPFSFRILPFIKDENQKSALIFCDIKNNPIDTRKLLENATDELIKTGFTPMLGTQLIYCIEQEENIQNFYQTFATNPSTIFNNNLVNFLLKANIDIEYYMPYGEKHQRIDLVPDVANLAADKLFTARWFAQNLGIQENKKISLENLQENYLSTCPVHMSLWKEKRSQNLFFDGEKEDELSSIGRKFIQGILYHQKSIQAIAKACTMYPIKEFENTYSNKRNYSILQVPLYFEEKQKRDRVGWSKRCIYNGLNADHNYYLMFATLLYAGLYGIQNLEETEFEKIKEIENINNSNKIIQNSSELKINSCSNKENINCLANNSYLKEKLGERIIQKVIKKLGGETE